MKKLLAVGVIVLFLGVSVIPSTGTTDVKQITVPTSKGDTLYVGGSGPNNYTKIQDAIDDASDGDTVFVYDDSSPYYENLIVDKSIDLVGENRNKTVVDGNFKGSVITINSDNVVVRGFTLKNIKDYYLFEGKYGCIKILGGNHVLVTDNIITPGELGEHMYGEGVYLYGSGTDENVIKDNIIFYDKHIGTAVGVKIVYGAGYNTIYNNEIYGCHSSVSIVPMGSDCNNNIIETNYFHDLNIGVSIEEPAFATRVISNKITNCGIWGVFLFFADDNLIEGNIIEHCKTGIDLSGYNCYYNSVVNNTLSDNNLGIEVNGNYNTIYHNNFINNIKNARAEYYIYNNWDNGYPSGGNYWDDYKGYDSNSDGIGDTPYSIPGGDNEDGYPLMEPYGMTELSLNSRDGLFKISGYIKNIGNNTALNVQWKITIDGGFVILGRNSSGIIKPLLPGEKVTVTTGIILGFGKIMITVAVWADNAPYVSRTTPGFLLLFFIQIKPGGWK